MKRPSRLVVCTWGLCLTGMMLSASATERMRYLYSVKEEISSPYPCEVTTHPYLSDGRPVATAKAGESFGPLEAGSYLIRETVAPGKVRTRYLAVAKPGWTVVQLTCGTTGDKLDSVVHPRRIPMNYYVGIDEAQKDTTFLGWQRDYGDEILLHLHPDSLGKIDPKFKTLKENWEAFTVPEIVDRLKALDAWMQDFGFEPLRGFASYTPANTLVAAMREVGWDILHSIIPEQNWSDGHWAINHWGMPNQPFYIASDDFRKSVARSAAGNDVLGMGMNSYHLYMPHVVMWGDNVCSPSHFLRWHRTVESGDMPVRYENFLDDYLKVAEGMTDSPYFLFTGYEFGRTFGTRSMTVHNRAGCELAIDKAKNGGKVVFATASDVADWFKRFRPTPSENVFTQRDYLAGTRIMDKPIDSGPSIGMEMKDYKACFAHLQAMPFYHYDYTIPWRFKAADVTAPTDFASADAKSLKVEERGPSFAKATEGREGGERMISVSAAVALPRVTPVCLWDRELVEVPAGVRVFVPPMLDDGRRHTVVELPKGFQGSLVLKCRVTGAPARAEFGGLVTPLWRVQTIGEGDRRHCYAFIDTPLLSPCTVRFTCPKDCRIDALEKPLGVFKKGAVVELAFTTRRTWYRFWGLTAAEIQPDAAGVAALERAAAEWKSFSDNAAVNLARTHAEDDAFFKSVVPKDEKLVLDVDCFGNAVFGERSRARPFDRCVFAANDKVTAKEYSDGGISYGKGKSFWVHPRGLTLQVEGLDSLGLRPGDMVRVRLCTVADEGEPLSYLVTARSGWNNILGSFVSPADLGNSAAVTGQRIVWNPPTRRSADGLMTLDVPADKIQDGTVSIGLRTNQKQILDDWFVDGGFIARLERIVVTVVRSATKSARGFTLHDAAARSSPDWFRKGVMYQIQPRAFTPEGTLAAAAGKLPGLAQLGVGIVYLCPVFVADDDMNREMWSPRQIKSGMDNPRNPYRIKDFFHVDPEYGTDEDLRAFVRTAHGCGIKVLLDLVYLHCGPTAKPVVEHPEYFSYDRDGKIVAAGWRYPKFDFENTAVREYFKSNMTYYLTDFDVDGFRCDVADGIPLDFWEDARVACERIKPDIVILAEGCKHANTRRAFDANYNWPVCLSWLRPILKGDAKEGCNQQWAAGGADVSAFRGARKLRAASEQYAALCPKGTLNVNFTENHDTVNDDYSNRMERVRGWDNQSLGLAFCFALRGIPLIYNGQEVADANRHSIFGHRPDCTVDWTNSTTGDGVRRLELVRRLAELRRRHAALTAGGETWLDNDCEEFVLSLVRSAEDGQDVVFVGNFDGHSRTVGVAGVNASKMRVALSNGARISGLSIEFQPWGFAYLIKEVK